ncbi:bumetanide-sensitive sodium-(potassium)-chloride cotransporter isoform X2 [Manduca sexta]|uniref:bumetanide-sensitive sodium-(potassium)-chloride cotransporter isoform X2 n=1 Tax=Manduca sexta TaxID=7130 RepID=UPI00188EEA19|nr:bumetanide-sensitive sodium-(potassium)-chloride cotransporter isoform X2 [Manduca sexta]
MSSPKDIELSPVKTEAQPSACPSVLKSNIPPVTDEEDVIIGRFRKISSAKSMAATNGNIQYPTEIPVRSDDVEAGLQFKKDPGEKDKLLPEPVTNGALSVQSKSPVTKSSFRDVEKPSRFKDQPSATRFQMEDKQDEEATDSDASDLGSDDPLTTTYDTKYGKSFRHFTREALPRLDNYRNVLSLHAAPRPTLDELHNASLSRKPAQVVEKDLVTPVVMSPNVKFGWIKGVLMRCLLNIWGVMLFLRLSWVVGQAGVAQSILLIMTTSVVTTITALSMSAISTNGVIKGGGTYYMISRSLGPEFGGSIGLIFSMANAVACAMYVVGFGESLITLIPESAYMVSKSWDQAIYGCITIVVLTGIVMVGMEWEAKAQIVLLVILLAAIADFCIGSIVGPKSDLEVAQGFVGYNMSVLWQNMGPDYRYFEGVEHNFFSVFAIFFPAATGILAGANISGDLKDPQKSIPKGTLLAILLTTLSYLGIAVVAGCTVLRDASGLLADLPAGVSDCAANRTCQYGLQNSNDVIRLVSAFGPLIYGGCFAATLSSALASLVSAPKVFQALCQDKLYPYLEFFAKGYGHNNEPVRGYVLTFIIATAFILMGGLNQIAPLISNFFLAAYALINFSTFHASLAKPVGWRPTFRLYNMWLSLVGAALCVAIMFVISWSTALVTFGFLLALYLLVSYRKPDVNWGSTTQAQTYKTALSGVHQLNRVTEHVKNYRPQILVLTGFPGERPYLTEFAYLLTKGLSLMICGHIIQGQVSHRTRSALASRAYAWFGKRRVKAFYCCVDDCGLRAGAAALLQAAGLGKLTPNILMMGFKHDWLSSPVQDIADYVEVMHKALDVHVAIALLRVEGGHHTADALDDDLRACLDDLNSNDLSAFSRSSLSDVSMGSPQLGRGVSSEPSAAPNKEQAKKSDDKESKGVGPAVRRARGAGSRRASSLSAPEQFTRRHAGTVDVWWLYDDGGLTLLLPYILSTRRAWSSCPLRVFTLANKNTELEIEERNMASLLSKFRIDYSALKMVSDITKRPKDSTLAYFDKLIAPFMTNDDSNDSDGITEADLLAARSRTHRHLRLRELIAEQSAGARLVCVTLPLPRRRGVLPAPLYVAWLHALATAADNTLLVRGNHSAVLTFYS